MNQKKDFSETLTKISEKLKLKTAQWIESVVLYYFRPLNGEYK